MPRRPRVFIEGGIYHVYNRFARGAEIFREGDLRRYRGLTRGCSPEVIREGGSVLVSEAAIWSATMRHGEEAAVQDLSEVVST